MKKYTNYIANEKYIVLINKLIEQYQNKQITFKILKNNGTIPYYVLLREIKKRNIPLHGCVKIKEEFKKDIVKSYIKGKPLKYLAQKYNTSKNPIRKLLIKQGIEIRSHSEESKKHKIKEDYFENINNEEKAYVLGFLYADGCNTRKGLGMFLQKRDKKFLERIISCLLENKEDVKLLCKENKKTNSYGFILSRKAISESLTKQGCVPNKSLILRFPTQKQVRSDLVFHFIRGYFDGDGCVTYNKKKDLLQVTFLGTEEFLLELQKILFLKNIDSFLYDIKETKIKNLYISLNSREKLYKELYKNSTIFLKRKFKKFKQKFGELK